ncbi:calcium-binding protein [Phenylobacterium sp.]|uniref:calcium-binding protein n=1 Tax=Phenylobacterium sp. TaxID=1871053 RepID=UPI00281199D5|nr:calcium-binding protein [Phenylobacterium sp.]
MPTYTIDFNSTTLEQLDPVDGSPYRPVENFFLASTADVLTLGQTMFDLGDSEYIFVNGTRDLSILTREPSYLSGEPQSFRVASIDLNGFTWQNFEPTGAQVTFKFSAVAKADPGKTLYGFFTTDVGAGFQTLNLANLVVTDADGVPLTDYTGRGFNQLLYSLSWVVIDDTAGGGAPKFAAYDDLVVITNSAPVTNGFADGTLTGKGVLGQLFTKQIAASDPDAERVYFVVDKVLVDGQDVTDQAVDLGIAISGAGVLRIGVQEGDAELATSRTVQVTYHVTDFEGNSVQKTLTVVQESAVPAGVNLCGLGTNKPDHVVGFAGNDTLCGDNQNDTLEGRGGNDLLHGDNGEDKLYGEAGHDRLEGGNGKDTLWGGTGNDTLYGENSPDRLDGGQGNDVLWGGNSPDEFVFRFDGGNDIVMDFDVKTDTMYFDISMFGVNSFADLKANGHLESVSGGVVIHYVGSEGLDNTIFLKGVSLSSLKAANFDFSMPGDIFG